MPSMPRPSKDARDIAYSILGTPTPLMEQEEKPKKKAKKEVIDVDYENSDIDVLKRR